MNLPPNRNRWPSWAIELFEERAGIIEFMGNLTRETAEFRAEIRCTEKRLPSGTGRGKRSKPHETRFDHTRHL